MVRYLFLWSLFVGREQIVQYALQLVEKIRGLGIRLDFLSTNPYMTIALDFNRKCC
jgi:hypothetical protein